MQNACYAAARETCLSRDPLSPGPSPDSLGSPRPGWLHLLHPSPPTSTPWTGSSQELTPPGPLHTWVLVPSAFLLTLEAVTLLPVPSSWSTASSNSSLSRSSKGLLSPSLGHMLAVHLFSTSTEGLGLVALPGTMSRKRLHTDTATVTGGGMTLR